MAPPLATYSGLAVLLLVYYCSSSNAYEPPQICRRRALLGLTGAASACALSPPLPTPAVTALEELRGQNSYLASLLVNTYDESTHDATVEFFMKSFVGMEQLREEKVR